MKPQGFDELSEADKAVFAELDRREAHAERISPQALTKLPKPLSAKAGECATVRRVFAEDHERFDEIAWSQLAQNSFEVAECAGEPLGYTDETTNGVRDLAVYWAKAV